MTFLVNSCLNVHKAAYSCWNGQWTPSIYTAWRATNTIKEADRAQSGHKDEVQTGVGDFSYPNQVVVVE